MHEPSPSLESLFHANKLSSWKNIPESFGNEFIALDGHTTFTRGKGVRSKYRLPALLDDRQCVLGDLIPQTSWGSSLANLLTKASWDRIRHPILDDVSRVCSVCGIQHTTLDIHERWSYHFPVEDMKRLDSLSENEIVFGIQRLDGFHPVCRSCHRCFHLGLARVRGELDEVRTIMEAVNQWSEWEMDDYIDTIGDRCGYAEQIYWGLDLSYVSDQKLEVRAPWHFGDPGQQFLTSESSMGQNLTIILNAEWSFARPKPDAIGTYFLSEQRFANDDAARTAPNGHAT